VFKAIMQNHPIHIQRKGIRHDPFADINADSLVRRADGGTLIQPTANAVSIPHIKRRFVEKQSLLARKIPAVFANELIAFLLQRWIGLGRGSVLIDSGPINSLCRNATTTAFDVTGCIQVPDEDQGFTPIGLKAWACSARSLALENCLSSLNKAA